MIYIDTNTLYYAAGVSQHDGIDVEKLNHTIQKECISISSTSIFELVMKYKNDLITVHKLGKYIDDNEIEIVFNDYFQMVDCHELELSSISEKQLEKLVDKIKEIKVNIESKFTTSVFCMCYFSGLYFSVVKGDTISSFTNEIFRIAMKLAAKVGEEKFKQYYIEGYDTDDCEKYIKNNFNNLLGLLFQVTIPYVQEAEKIDGEVDVNKFIDENNWTKLSEQIENKLQRVPISTFYLKKIATKYWKNEQDDHLKQFFEDFSGTINKFPEKALREYIQEIMKTCCIEGGTFWKNDILDAIILCHIKDGDKLITFDIGVQNHMKKYKNEKQEYNDSLNIIDSFYL